MYSIIIIIIIMR